MLDITKGAIKNGQSREAGFIVPSVCTVVSVCDITGMYLFIVPSVCTVVSVCDITGMYLFTLDQIY
jgi:hypothetical protein